ncbi:MAG TPA: hypothetical protein VNW89_17150, partial [Stellaceae bacterium]|nr:hypothetical protein [Stellaceae bacterium]
MAPARTGDEGLTVEEVERLGVRRLAEIVVKHCYRDEGLLQTVRIALAASAPGDALVKTLAAEIDAIRGDRRFYGYRQSSTLAHELDRNFGRGSLVPRAVKLSEMLVKAACKGFSLGSKCIHRASLRKHQFLDNIKEITPSVALGVAVQDLDAAGRGVDPQH